MQSMKQTIPSWVKSCVHGLTDQYRYRTRTYRSLPDFIIIGAQKSGTSSLYRYISQHPQLLPSSEKEVHFFDGGIDPKVDNYEKGEMWYRSHFPLQKDTSEDTRVFEASPLYIFNPLCPKRISDLLPNIKIIALLRNPTERAISQYFHELRLDRESLSIHEALETEETRLARVLETEDYKSDHFICHSYKARGLYREQLERYLFHFSKEQLLFMNSEELFTNPDAFLKQIFEFIGVDAYCKVKDLKPRNVASNRRHVDPEIYNYLNSFFQPHNRALYELIGKNYGW
jgi:hypothetical protein